MDAKRRTAAWAVMLGMAVATPRLGAASGRPLVIAGLQARQATSGERPGLAGEASSILPRVRSSDNALAGLMDQARRGSETFRRLLTIIQTSNGIVYVEPGPCGHGVRACLKMWMQVSGPNRFIRIMINRSKTDRDVDVMGAIGHELQHAIEVLSEPAVTNGVTMFNFLRRTAPTDRNQFETTAAINAGNAVIDELMGQRAAR